MEPERVNEILKKLKDYENIIIMGPTGSGSYKHKLRMYCNGGVIGHIATTKKADCNLMLPSYYSEDKNHYKNCTPEEKAWLKEKRLDEVKAPLRHIYLDCDMYLKIAEKVTAHKFLKEKNEDKERKQQVQIIKLSRDNKNLSWEIVDIETGITNKWINNSDIIKNVKKPDFVVFDKIRKQFGIIELKYNNESVDNLAEHYRLMQAIYEWPKKFNENMKKRMPLMEKFGFLSNGLHENVDIEAPVWFGFLFIGGSKKQSITDINKKILSQIDGFDVKKINPDCRFLYADTVEELISKAGLSYNSMLSYEDFTNS